MTNAAERRAHNRDDCGFTLVELLMVIVILGVLASLTVFAVGGATAQAATTHRCRADFKTVETAQEAYEAQVGTPAVTIGDLRGQSTGPSGVQVGPWLKDDVGNASLYRIAIDDGTISGGKVGDITVQSVTPLHGAQDGSANCSYA